MNNASTYHPSARVGILSLPRDTLLRIVDYIPHIPTPLILKNKYIHFLESPLPDTEPRLQRTRTLKALSHTCRELRAFALPLAWRSIEVLSCDEDVGRAIWAERLAKDLVRQLEMVTVQNPSLAQYVRTVSVMLGAHSYALFSRAFRKLADLPNLQSINIVGEAGDGSWFTPALVGQTLLSVRQVVIPDYAYSLLWHCPNVEEIYVVMDQEEPFCHGMARKILPDIFRRCRKIKKIEGMPISWKKDLDDMLDMIPDITDIHLNSYGFYVNFPSANTMSRFTGFKNLQNLTLNIYDSDSALPAVLQDVEYNRGVDRGLALLLGWEPLSTWDSDTASDDEDEEPAWKQYIMGDQLTSSSGSEGFGDVDEGVERVPADSDPEASRLFSVDYQGCRTMTVNFIGSKRDLFAKITIDPVQDDKSDEPTDSIRRQVGHRVASKFREVCCMIDVEDFSEIEPEMLEQFDHEHPLQSPPMSPLW